MEPVGTYLLNVQNLQDIPNPEENFQSAGNNMSYRDFIHQRTNGSMQIISEWASSHSPTGLGLFLFSDNTWKTMYEHESVGYIAIGDDSLIYTQSENIYNSQLTQINSLPGLNLIPGIGGTLFLGIASDGSIQIYSSGSTTPIGPGGSFPGFENEENVRSMYGQWAEDPYVFDRHVIFNPILDYIILIPPENDRIIQRDFSLEQLLQKAGVDYLVVVSQPDIHIAAGTTWQYKIETLSNNNEIKFSLDFAPEGMNIQDDGTLTWAVPSDHSGGTEKVVVLVENGIGDSTYHNFELNIKPLP
ncbi:hypothetical protein [Candidatus Oscillochloris fontis]|uniref:hypothetical protein n=1 Tax=Candidatus Oscillochloris fontis TaxID=2496868 RepID=UPI00101CE08E|nr:hypothetical protein [Candidatus Oscillochloris fontis]